MSAGEPRTAAAVYNSDSDQSSSSLSVASPPSPALAPATNHHSSTDPDMSDPWTHIRNVTERSGPFATTLFEASPDLLPFLRDNCKILVIGAGGLGCELLKDLALMGFHNLTVIDMDTIDISNLNRQFLFRPKDVGRSKAEVAAEFIKNRIPSCKVEAHNAKIQDFEASFYRQFYIIVCGLDSIVARRWMNGMVLSLLEYGDEDGELKPESVIPLIDGGTEGFKGNARVILPGMTACLECTLDLYPPQVNYPMCTIAHTPRLPEHCIEYVRLLLWPKEEPFGANVAIDGDDPAHIQWIHEASTRRAAEYGISGITYRLTQGVVKHIIPAVASTNAIIAAACATEVFKVVTNCCHPMENYMVFNDTDGLYTFTFKAERNETCLACSQRPQTLSFSTNSKLRDVLEYLGGDKYQMRSPGVTTTVNGRNKTLYMQSVKSIEAQTRANLKMSLNQLGLVNGQEILVADITSPNTLIFKLNLSEPVEN